MSSYVDSPVEPQLRPRNWLESWAASVLGSHADRRRAMLGAAVESATRARDTKHSMNTRRQLGFLSGEGNGLFLTRTTLNRDGYIEEIYAKNRDKILEANRVRKEAEANPKGPEAAAIAKAQAARAEKRFGRQ